MFRPFLLLVCAFVLSSVAWSANLQPGTVTNALRNSNYFVRSSDLKPGIYYQDVDNSIQSTTGTYVSCFSVFNFRTLRPNSMATWEDWNFCQQTFVVPEAQLLLATGTIPLIPIDDGSGGDDGDVSPVEVEMMAVNAVIGAALLATLMAKLL